jgi:hypothetical protein
MCPLFRAPTERFLGEVLSGYTDEDGLQMRLRQCDQPPFGHGDKPKLKGSKCWVMQPVGRGVIKNRRVPMRQSPDTPNTITTPSRR